MRARFAALAAALLAAVGLFVAAPIAHADASTGSLLHPAATYATLTNLRYTNVTTSAAGLADAYVPLNGYNANPVIIWVHGGGWSSMSKSDGADKLIPLVKMGYVVISINYRLSSEAKWPAQIIDVKTAVRAVRANAASIHAWPDKIGIWGASAGGQLATIAAYTSGDPTWDQGDWPGVSSAVAAVQDDFGPTDLGKWTSQQSGFAYPDPNTMVTPLLGCAASACPDKAANASPATWVKPGVPPTAIWHGSADITVPPAQSVELRDALTAAGDTVTYTVQPGMAHGDPTFYTAARVTGVGQWFDGYLRP